MKRIPNGVSEILFPFGAGRGGVEKNYSARTKQQL